MRSTAIVLIAGLGVGGSHALLLRRLVAHQPSSVGVMRLVRGALALRLLLLAMLLSAGLLASAEGILIALAGLWVGRTAMVVERRSGVSAHEPRAPYRVWLAGVPVTTTVVATTALVVILSALAMLAGRRLQQQPAGWQAVAEWGVRLLCETLDEATGHRVRYLPLVATVAIFVVTANLLSAVPFVEAPTADINTPAALAAIVFFSVHYYGMREAGVRAYLKRFAQPTVILLPINVLSNLTRTFSLAIRLFGNMVSHQVIAAILLLIVPVIVPALLEAFGLFVGVLQAYIFTILTIVYIGGAVRAGTEL